MTSKPITAVVVAVIVVALRDRVSDSGLPGNLGDGFAAPCAAVTTIMVFTIQHTQAATGRHPAEAR